MTTIYHEQGFDEDKYFGKQALTEQEVLDKMNQMSVADFTYWCQTNMDILPFGTWAGWLLTKAEKVEEERNLLLEAIGIDNPSQIAEVRKFDEDDGEDDIPY